MTNIRNALMQAAGSASGDKVYVEDVFSTHLYTGNNTAGNAINNGLDLSGEGGMVWIKARNATDNSCIFDTERGVTKFISSGNNNAESTDANSLTSFNNNGFTLGTGWTIASVNYTYNYASWAFRKQKGFFDVVTYTGDGNTSKTINHNLGCKPGMIIIKMLTESGYAWRVWHKSVASSNGSNYSLSLNNTTGAANGSSSPGGYWNFTAPTSTNFTVGNYGQVNNNGSSFVAYLFADGDESDAQIFGDDGDEAIIKTGSFTGTTSGEVSVNLGFEPQFIIYKLFSNASSSNNDNWRMHDNMRGWNVNNRELLNPNVGSAESSLSNTSGYEIKPTSTGFIHEGHGTSSDTWNYIYMAIRRGPMKEPSAGTDVFKAISRTGGGGSASITGVGFSPDLYLSKATNQGSYNPLLYNRLRGKRYLLTSATDAQPNSDGGLDSYDMDGVSVSGGSSFGLDGSGDSIINYFFKRYPKVFDVVVYSPLLSDPVPRNVHNHNLTVKPELIIVKQTTSVYGARNWAVGAPDLLGVTSSDTLGLNLDVAEGGTGTYNLFDSTQPTATQFTVGYNTTGVGVFGESYIAYLFASLDGISKVGTYTGTGNDLNVTGLNAAARFVLIKRTDASGDWYVYDSTSGIVSGNDPYFFINSTAVSVTNTDYIDPHSSGFTVTSSAPAALNASSGTYIYLAFA
jgi:hypothetical protein